MGSFAGMQWWFKSWLPSWDMMHFHVSDANVTIVSLGGWVSYCFWRQPIVQFQGILSLWGTLGTVIIAWINSKLCSAALDKQLACTGQVWSFFGLQIPGHRGQLWFSYDLHDTPVDMENVLNAFVYMFWRVSDQTTRRMTY